MMMKKRPHKHKIKHHEYKARSRIIAFIALIFALTMIIFFLNAQFTMPTGRAYDATKCGNGVVEASNGEECEPLSDAACPGKCRSDCICNRCGNNVLDSGEECDGAWDMACPGYCDTDCDCPPDESRYFTSKYRQSFSYDILNANDSIVLVSNYQHLALMSITVKNPFKTLEDVKFNIDTNISKPPNVIAPAEFVYQYYSIGTQNSSHLQYYTAKHEFKVPKAWLLKSNLSESSVELNRYRNGLWKVLPTTNKSGDINYAYYEMSAEGYGMSLFAISADRIPVATAATPAAPAATSAICGNGVLESGENQQNCCSDAGCILANESCINNKCVFAARCGNGVCEPGERVKSCIIDCAVSVKFLLPTLAIFVTLAIIVAFAVSFSVIGRHGEHKPGKKQRGHIMQSLGSEKEQLEEYTKEHLGKGFTEREIERELLKAGWERDFVDKVIFETRSKVERTTRERRGKERGH